MTEIILKKADATPRRRKTQGKRTKQTISAIVDSGNHYLAAVKGNQPTLYRTALSRSAPLPIQEEFIPEQSNYQINKGHGRIEKRRVTLLLC